MAKSAPETDKSQVFVRGLAASATKESVEALFADLGPIRNCFLVTDKGSNKHKGFGFVQFALAEDAQRAATQITGTEFEGRRLRVSSGCH